MKKIVLTATLALALLPSISLADSPYNEDVYEKIDKPILKLKSPFIYLHRKDPPKTISKNDYVYLYQYTEYSPYAGTIVDVYTVSASNLKDINKDHERIRIFVDNNGNELKKQPENQSKALQKKVKENHDSKN